MYNKQSSNSLQVKIQAAARWKYKADKATKTLTFSLLMPMICILKQSPHSSDLTKASQRRKRLLCMNTYHREKYGP